MCIKFSSKIEYFNSDCLASILKETPTKKKRIDQTHWKTFSNIIILHSKRSVPDRNASRQNIDQMYIHIFRKTFPPVVTRSNGVRGWRRKKTGSYRCTYSWHVRCEKKLVYMYGRDGRGSISVFALREPGFSKWCFVRRYSNRPLCQGRSLRLEKSEQKIFWRTPRFHKTRIVYYPFSFCSLLVRISTCYSWICALFCCYDDDNEGEHCYRERREFCFDIGEGRFRLQLDWCCYKYIFCFCKFLFFSLRNFKDWRCWRCEKF